MRLVDETFHALRRKLCPFVLQPKRHLCEGAQEGSMCARTVCVCVGVWGSVCLPSRCCLPACLGWSWLQSGASRAAAARGKEAVWLWLAGVVSTFARHPLGGALAGIPEGVVGGGRGSKRTSQDWRKPKTLSKHVAGAAGANVSCCSLSTAREQRSECVCVCGGGSSRWRGECGKLS